MQSEEMNFKIFEFVEFQVGKGNYGIGVGQIREIIHPVPVTFLPHAHPYLEGIIQLRGEVVPVINMKKIIGDEETGDTQIIDESKFLIAEFNESTVALNVTAVTQIQRIHFEEIEPVSDVYANMKIPVSGIVKREKGMILLVDFESVVEEQIKKGIVKVKQ